MDIIDNTKKYSRKNVSNKKAKNESKRKKSHLHFQDRCLKNIPQFHEVEDVLVLYLYNNEITSIENLDEFQHLSSLYLQNNKIEIIENFKHVTNLRKLFIGQNKISVLEGLEYMKCLQELHIEKQCLPNNIPLCIDPRTIMCISESLQFLNISHNNISALCYLAPLKNLRAINASFNDLDDIVDVCQTIHNWCYLSEAIFTGNPFTKRYRYREEIIANSHGLETLDGKAISDITRSFIRKFEAEKLLHGSRQNGNIADVCPNLSKNYSPFLRKTVSACLLKKSIINPLNNSLSLDEEKNDVYVAWNTLPTRKPCLKIPQHLRNKKIHLTKRITTSFPQISHI